MDDMASELASSTISPWEQQLEDNELFSEKIVWMISEHSAGLLGRGLPRGLFVC